MPPAESGDGPRTSFPALDTEPSSRRRPPLLLAALFAALIAVAAGVTVALWPAAAGAPRAGRPSTAQPARVGLTESTGRVLLLTPPGALALTAPERGSLTRLTGLGSFAGAARPATPTRSAAAIPVVSPDGRFLLAGGRVFPIKAGLPTAAAQPKLDLTGKIGTAVSEPFADHDNDLVAMTGTGPGFQVAVVSAATGRAVPLGTAGEAAGDPEATGAFVSVAAAGSVPAGRTGPDAEVELRDAGRKPLLLATAARLNKIVGNRPGSPVALELYPAPAGDNIAVLVRPASGSQSAGVVVLDRTGRLVGSVLTSLGPPATGRLAWSPSGQELAYTTLDLSQATLNVWTVGGASQSYVFPPTIGTDFSPLFWAPDGSAVLCTVTAGGTIGEWTIARITIGIMAVRPAPGTPVGWLQAVS